MLWQRPSANSRPQTLTVSMLLLHFLSLINHCTANINKSLRFKKTHDWHIFVYKFPMIPDIHWSVTLLKLNFHGHFIISNFKWLEWWKKHPCPQKCGFVLMCSHAHKKCSFTEEARCRLTSEKYVIQTFTRRVRSLCNLQILLLRVDQTDGLVFRMSTHCNR